ncbi:MAG: response regulator, partial [Candidatus Thiodiazotropha sp.]
MKGIKAGFGNQSDRCKASCAVSPEKAGFGSAADVDRTSETHLQERHMSSPPKVLIIDDTEEVLSALCKYFKQKKYDVLSASNGLDGLKMIENDNDSLDIIITDLVLPNISGVAVISIVKKKFPNLPVIAITGWGEHPESLAKEANADLVMVKPFKLPELEKAARE